MKTQRAAIGIAVVAILIWIASWVSGFLGGYLVPIFGWQGTILGSAMTTVLMSAILWWLLRRLRKPAQLGK